MGMTIEISVVIAIVSLTFAIYQGIRTKKTDDKSDASQMTMVIIKLENIGNGIADIKNEMKNVKSDIKEDRERLIIVEESTKAAHKRMDVCEKYCKRFSGIAEQ